MKFVLCVVTAFAVFHSTNCYVASNDMNQLQMQQQLRMLRERMQLRSHSENEQIKNKFEEICPGHGSRIENITMEIGECVSRIDKDEETMCSLAQNHLETCIAPLINTMEECLPVQSKKVPSMLVKMILAVTKRLCKTDGEHIFELVNPCVRHVTPKTERCIRRLRVKSEEYARSSTFPSVQELCDAVEELRPCLQSHLNAACGHPITRESFLQMFDEMASVCKSHELNEIEVLEPSMA